MPLAKGPFRFFKQLYRKEYAKLFFGSIFTLLFELHFELRFSLRATILSQMRRPIQRCKIILNATRPVRLMAFQIHSLLIKFYSSLSLSLKPLINHFLELFTELCLHEQTYELANIGIQTKHLVTKVPDALWFICNRSDFITHFINTCERTMENHLITLIFKLIANIDIVFVIDASVLLLWEKLHAILYLVLL